MLTAGVNAHCSLVDQVSREASSCLLPSYTALSAPSHPSQPLQHLILPPGAQDWPSIPPHSTCTTFKPKLETPSFVHSLLSPYLLNIFCFAQIIYESLLPLSPLPELQTDKQRNLCSFLWYFSLAKTQFFNFKDTEWSVLPQTLQR